MRQIKFRAWDTQEKCWFDSWCIHCNGHFKMNNDEWSDIPDRIKIMQFTGCKDKNGVEIWEGDIVINERGEKGVIEYRSGGFVSKYLPPYNWDVFEPIDGLLNRQTVIGNLYKAPDLLDNKEEKENER
jgi:uncharacterized phage protein (TIGR01671 family)